MSPEQNFQRPRSERDLKHDAAKRAVDILMRENFPHMVTTDNSALLDDSDTINARLACVETLLDRYRDNMRDPIALELQRRHQLLTAIIKMRKTLREIRNEEISARPPSAQASGNPVDGIKNE